MKHWNQRELSQCTQAAGDCSRDAYYLKAILGDTIDKIRTLDDNRMDSRCKGCKEHKQRG